MKHRDYFMLPNEIFSLGLKPRDFAVLACLIRHKDNENDNCYPSRDLISKECCIKIKTVDAALKELEKRSLIVKKHRLRENGSHTSKPVCSKTRHPEFWRSLSAMTVWIRLQEISRIIFRAADSSARAWSFPSINIRRSKCTIRCSITGRSKSPSPQEKT